MTGPNAIALLEFGEPSSPEYADALKLAIEALHAQEPRVMTLEEAKTLKQDTVVWYEHTGINPPRPRIVHYADNKGITFTDGGVWLFDEDNYGKNWRCWTSKPSLKQMEETPRP